MSEAKQEAPVAKEAEDINLNDLIEGLQKQLILASNDAISDSVKLNLVLSGAVPIMLQLLGSVILENKDIHSGMEKLANNDIGIVNTLKELSKQNNDLTTKVTELEEAVKQQKAQNSNLQTEVTQLRTELQSLRGALMTRGTGSYFGYYPQQ